MGQQQAKTKAIKALQFALEKAEPSLSQEQKDAITTNFEKELRFHPQFAKKFLVYCTDAALAFLKVGFEISTKS